MFLTNGGKDSSRNIMPYAENRPRQGSQRIHGKVKRGERHGEAAVLHAHFNGNSRFLRIGNTQHFSRRKTKAHADNIMQNNNRQHQ